MKNCWSNKKAKMGLKYRKLFKQLLEDWEDESEEEKEDEDCESDYKAGITNCVWALNDFLAKHFYDWEYDD